MLILLPFVGWLISKQEVKINDIGYDNNFGYLFWSFLGLFWLKGFNVESPNVKPALR